MHELNRVIRGVTWFAMGFTIILTVAYLMEVFA